MYKVYLFERTNQRLIVEIEDTIRGFADRMKTLDENFKGIDGRSGTEVGGHLRIRRSVIVVGGCHRCKWWLSPILLQCVGVGIAADGIVSGFLAGAVGGHHWYVQWQQCLKVVKAEGVGPVGWREKRRKKIWGGILGKNETLHSFTLQILIFFFFKSITFFFFKCHVREKLDLSWVFDVPLTFFCQQIYILCPQGHFNNLLLKLFDEIKISNLLFDVYFEF
jgi:hypothetical protein